MVLRYLQRCYGPGVKTLTQQEISKICKTTVGGTEYDAAKHLSRCTVSFTPSVEFEFQRNQTIKNIQKQLSMNHPVIALVEMETDDDAFRGCQLKTSTMRLMWYIDTGHSVHDCACPIVALCGHLL